MRQEFAYKNIDENNNIRSLEEMEMTNVPYNYMKGVMW
jgi:hypothetical protein